MEQRNPTIRFQRIDADVTETAKEEVAEEDQETFKKTSDSLIEIFRKELGNDKLDVKIAKLKDENVASMITLSEQSRRMQEMMKMYGMNDMGMDLGGESTLILNANHPLVQYVVDHADSENTSVICKQLYDLAMLAHKPLNPEEMTAFVKRSNEINSLHNSVLYSHIEKFTPKLTYRDHFPAKKSGHTDPMRVPETCPE